MLVITQTFVSRHLECQCRLVTYLLNFISTLFTSNLIALKEKNSSLETKIYVLSMLYSSLIISSNTT